MLEEFTSHTPKSEAHLPFHFYSERIREKFQRADKNIIDRLGKLNWERYQRVRDLKVANAEEDDVLKIQEAAPSVISGSQFHDSGLGSSLPAHSSYARTMPSSFKDSTSDIQSRIPPVSEEAKRGSPFSCVGCGRMIQARSTRDYDSNSMSRDIGLHF